jgi:hypothetical protein
MCPVDSHWRNRMRDRHTGGQRIASTLAQFARGNVAARCKQSTGGATRGLLMLALYCARCKWKW